MGGKGQQQFAQTLGKGGIAAPAPRPAGSQLPVQFGSLAQVNAASLSPPPSVVSRLPRSEGTLPSSPLSRRSPHTPLTHSPPPPQNVPGRVRSAPPEMNPEETSQGGYQGQGYPSQGGYQQGQGAYQQGGQGFTAQGTRFNAMFNAV